MPRIGDRRLEHPIVPAREEPRRRGGVHQAISEQTPADVALQSSRDTRKNERARAEFLDHNRSGQGGIYLADLRICDH